MGKAHKISIYSLYASGGLDFVIELGILKPTIEEYCKIYAVFIEYRKKYNYTNAIGMTAEKMCLSESKVRVAVATVI